MTVDWSELMACGGYASAKDVPNAIEALFSPLPEVREGAYWQIDNYVVVQGGLYESAPYAARLIVDILKANPEKINLEVLDLLFELANGNAGGINVEHGLLKGQSIQQLCRNTVAEVLPILARAQAAAGGREEGTIKDILEIYDAGDKPSSI